MVASARSLEILALVERDYESPVLDYKAVGSWAVMSNAAKAELARDMMALANGDEQGWIILGVSQAPGGGFVAVGLEESEAQTFDPSVIGTFVKRYADPEVRFTVHVAEIGNRRFVGIAVAPFDSVPHVCTALHGDTLQEGAVYVRTEAAQTSKVTTAGQMRRLLDRGIQVHADNIVRRVEQLFEQVHGPLPGEPVVNDKDEFERKALDAHRRAGGDR